MQNSLTQIVEKRIAFISKQVAEYKAKLDDSFMYNFEWGYAGDLYMAMAEKKQLDLLLTFISKPENSDKVLEALKREIEVMTKDILRGGFVGTSTSNFSNIAHTMKKEVSCKLIDVYEDYLNEIVNYSLKIS